MRSIHLLGGGWHPAAAPLLYGPFLDSAGHAPVVATVVLDEGDGPEQFARWRDVLHRTGRCEPVPVLVPLGATLDVAALGDADAVLICGGLTPAYADALSPVAPDVAAWLAERDRPYAGFSAGAAVAASRAVVGGWRHDGVQVCPEDAAEDLEKVTVVPGLGLVDWLVDVHCAQWGTLPRLLAAVGAVGGTGVALDENTALHCDTAGATVAGLGVVRHLTPEGNDVRVRTLRPGGYLPAGG